MNTKPKRDASDDESKLDAPENPGADAKAQLPDEDHTDESTLDSDVERASQPSDDARFADEHSISREHSEPTDVTGTSNDAYLDEPYIDIGGGD